MKKKSFLLPMLILMATYACKKVDNINQYKESLPSIDNYVPDYTVGDTITIIGRLFYQTGDLKIHIGNADGAILSHSTTITYVVNEPVTLDIVKMVITQQMGIGKNIPVTITTNGHTLDAWPVNIRQFIDIASRTDTTLFVEKMSSWTPEDLSIYQVYSTTRRRNMAIPYFGNATVNPEGEVSFFSAMGVFRVVDGQVSQLMAAGQTFTGDGDQFSIKYFIGATNTTDPNIFYFSAEVQEDDPSTTTQFVYRFCKYDAAKGAVTTLNRSALFIQPEGQTISAVPYEGEAAAVKLVATDLKMSLSGDLYFINSYSIATATRTQDLSHVAVTGTNQNQQSTDNLCSYKNGKIASLVASHGQNAGFEAPGLPVFSGILDYTLSPDGNSVLTANSGNGVSAPALAVYDIDQHRQLYPLDTRNMRFKSFDSDPQTTFPYKAYSFYIGYFTTADNKFLVNGIISPNGEIVYGIGSLGAFNYLANTAYAYAGTEIGLLNSPSDLVDEGRAKNVDFYSKHIFGIDKSANFYFWKPEASGGISFYKMYSKK